MRAQLDPRSPGSRPWANLIAPAAASGTARTGARARPRARAAAVTAGPTARPWTSRPPACAHGTGRGSASARCHGVDGERQFLACVGDDGRAYHVARDPITCRLLDQRRQCRDVGAAERLLVGPMDQRLGTLKIPVGQHRRGQRGGRTAAVVRTHHGAQGRQADLVAAALVSQ